MTIKEDIFKRINTDFKEDADQAIGLLNNAIRKSDYLNTDRVVRCIVFLAKGNMDNLIKYLEVAANDTRDVMLWAEYEKLNNDFNFKRIRDFNKTFEECLTDVKE